MGMVGTRDISWFKVRYYAQVLFQATSFRMYSFYRTQLQMTIIVTKKVRLVWTLCWLQKRGQMRSVVLLAVAKVELIMWNTPLFMNNAAYPLEISRSNVSICCKFKSLLLIFYFLPKIIMLEYGIVKWYDDFCCFFFLLTHKIQFVFFEFNFKHAWNFIF